MRAIIVIDHHRPRVKPAKKTVNRARETKWGRGAEMKWKGDVSLVQIDHNQPPTKTIEFKDHYFWLVMKRCQGRR